MIDPEATHSAVVPHQPKESGVRGPVVGHLTPRDLLNLAEALKTVEHIAVSTLTQLDNAKVGIAPDPDAAPIDESIADLLNYLFDAYDAVSSAGIVPEYPDWYDVREQMRTP